MNRRYKSFEGSAREFILNRSNSELLKSSSSERIKLFKPANLWHIYLHLKFEQKHEYAENKADAISFLSNVGKAAQISTVIASLYDGLVIETQGASIHIILPVDETNPSLLYEFTSILHARIKRAFPKNSNVINWRMAADSGNTMLVEASDIHGDHSCISLGRSANNPAKQLYKGIEDGTLESYNLIYADNGIWRVIDLDKVIDEIHNRSINFSKSAELEDSMYNEVIIESYLKKSASRLPGDKLINCQAAPVRSVQSTGDNPDNNSPDSYYGWTMRADLDGFSKRVEECFDDDNALELLAKQFYELMNKASSFSAEHEAELIQLPWAGDNYTAVITFDSKEDYLAALKEDLIGYSIDFDDAMHEEAINCNFGGWAQGVAGCGIDSRASGNVFLGSVLIEGRRMLVATGKGIGMSLKAFVAMNPNPKELVLHTDDLAELNEDLKECFKPLSINNGKGSSYFQIADTNNLKDVSDQIYTSPKVTPITVGTETVKHSTSNHYQK